MSFSLKNIFSKTIGALFGRVVRAVKPSAKTSPVTDRLLVDAIRLAELPSPAPGEQPRAAFVLERLKSFGLTPVVNGSGSILVRLHAEKAGDEAPVLLFTDMGTKRWHPSESLARLDAENAAGAGLSDSLGCAALLLVAENFYNTLEQNMKRDLLLLFNAGSPDDPNLNFDSILNHPKDRPCAAIGVRGLSLDRIIQSVGSYRLRITVTGNEEKLSADNNSNKVTETLIDTARTLLGIAWDTEGKTIMFIRRLEALTVYGLTPREGILELEIESSEAPQLELAMNAVKATAEKISEKAKLKTETRLLSYIPPGKPEKSRKLFEILKKLCKEQRLKILEENGADPAAFFSGEDIPALSMGIALGREGSERDEINIDSVEKGALILQRFIVETGTHYGS
ncbi:MAG: hypothetical protein FWG99_09845 [Treponema sp.]|nr:hypothetical protein [Treponema sp.]